MTTTLNTNTNGRTRQTLASQLDRLDSILDGLAEGLNDAVATTVQEAVGVAVQEAVRGVMTELLTNADLRVHVAQAMAASSPPPAEPPSKKNGGGRPGRFTRICTWVGNRMREAHQAGAAALEQVGRGTTWLCRQISQRLRTVLLVGAGFAAAGVAFLARTHLAALARSCGNVVTRLAGKAWTVLRGMLPAAVLVT
jgi:hypothetical protein